MQKELVSEMVIGPWIVQGGSRNGQGGNWCNQFLRWACQEISSEWQTELNGGLWFFKLLKPNGLLLSYEEQLMMVLSNKMDNFYKKWLLKNLLVNIPLEEECVL